MSTVFLALAILCGIALVVGFVWTLVAGGRVRRTQGPEVGAEIMGDAATDEYNQEKTTVAERSVFKGTGKKADVDTDVSFSEIKRLLQAGQWRRALPGLLVAGGLLGMLLFGALTLLASLENKILGSAAVVVALYIAITELRSFARA